MDSFIDHLLKYDSDIAFVENEKKFSYKTFIHDIREAEKEIRKQIDNLQYLFEWDYSICYKNIVLLFAFAKSKGIIIPDNITGRLFPFDEYKIIQCSGIPVKVFTGIQNVFTEELKKRDSPGLIISTSGTGAMPRDFVQDFGLLCEKYFKLKTKLTTVLAFSLEHISGIEAMLSILCPGGTIVLVPGRDPLEIAKALKENQADLISCTPTFLIRFYLKKLLTPEFFQSVKNINCGGEPLSPYWYEVLSKEIPWVKIKQAFGTTEASLFKTETHPVVNTKFKPGIFNTDYCIKENILFLRNQQYMLGNWNENKIISYILDLNSQSITSVSVALY